jgi:hypothetical protein
MAQNYRCIITISKLLKDCNDATIILNELDPEYKEELEDPEYIKKKSQ